MPGSTPKTEENKVEAFCKELHEKIQDDQYSEICSSPSKRRKSIKCEEPEWEEVEIDIGWGILRGKATGNGSQLVLGIHGWLDNANTFDLIAPLLPKDVRLLSLDLPGHGRSDHFPPGFMYDPQGYIGAVKKAVMVLGWQRFILLGHSMGAVVGIMYTSIFPDDVEAFMSIDIIKPWSSPAEKYTSQFKKYFTQYFNNEIHSTKPPLVYEEEELVIKTMEGSKSLDDRGARILLRRGAKKTDDGKSLILSRDLRAKVHFIGFISLEGWLEMARSIKCPLLIIKATNGHQYETKDRYDQMLAAFNENCIYFSYTETEGKHHVHLTHPEIVASYINSFLEKYKTAHKNGVDHGHGE